MSRQPRRIPTHDETLFVKWGVDCWRGDATIIGIRPLRGKADEEMINLGTPQPVYIGDRTIIGAQCLIYHDVRIGDDCHIGDQVVIHEECRIGHHVRIGSGAVITSGSLLINGYYIPAGCVYEHGRTR